MFVNALMIKENITINTSIYYTRIINVNNE